MLIRMRNAPQQHCHPPSISPRPAGECGGSHGSWFSTAFKNIKIDRMLKTSSLRVADEPSGTSPIKHVCVRKDLELEHKHGSGSVRVVYLVWIVTSRQKRKRAKKLKLDHKLKAGSLRAACGPWCLAGRRRAEKVKLKRQALTRVACGSSDFLPSENSYQESRARSQGQGTAPYVLRADLGTSSMEKWDDLVSSITSSIHLRLSTFRAQTLWNLAHGKNARSLEFDHKRKSGSLLGSHLGLESIRVPC